MILPTNSLKIGLTRQKYLKDFEEIFLNILESSRILQFDLGRDPCLRLQLFFVKIGVHRGSRVTAEIYGKILILGKIPKKG